MQSAIDRFAVVKRPPDPNRNKWPWRNMAVGEVISYSGSADEIRKAQKAATSLHVTGKRFATWKVDGILFVQRLSPSSNKGSDDCKMDYLRSIGAGQKQNRKAAEVARNTHKETKQ